MRMCAHLVAAGGVAPHGGIDGALWIWGKHLMTPWVLAGHHTGHCVCCHNGADREILWCSPINSQAEHVGDQQLA